METSKDDSTVVIFTELEMLAHEREQSCDVKLM